MNCNKIRRYISCFPLKLYLGTYIICNVDTSLKSHSHILVRQLAIRVIPYNGDQGCVHSSKSLASIFPKLFCIFSTVIVNPSYVTSNEKVAAIILVDET